MTRRLSVLFAILAFAAGGGAAAQSLLAAHTLTGRVTDASDRVLPGALVELTRPAESNSLRTVTTDAAGRYRIEKIVPGLYVLTFRLPGFAPAIRDVEIGGGSEEFQFDVALTAAVAGVPNVPGAQQPSRRVVCGMTMITPPLLDPGIHVPKRAPAGEEPVKPAIRAIQPTMCWEPGDARQR